MAPECILMFEEASFQTDMWSLGATYLEILTGSAPWMVKKQRELAALMATKTPPHALSHLSDKNSFLGGLVSYDPDSRPSASDVVKFLKSGLDLTSKRFSKAVAPRSWNALPPSLRFLDCIYSVCSIVLFYVHLFYIIVKPLCGFYPVKSAISK
uniref:Protein kinase domain-containing protein n=1 Tax=Maylandia zebra TaxID=106582 RepID=A0A3P9DKD0_9CICH